MAADFWNGSLQSVPDPAFTRGNASAIFGAGPSFGLNPAVPASEENARFKPNKPVVRRNSQRKPAQERPTVRRSKSDVGTSRRAIERRRSRDLDRVRKLSESSVAKTVNGNCSHSTSPNESASLQCASDASVDGESGLQTRLEENGVRYPLFVPVAGALSGRTRVARPVAKRAPNTGSTGRNSKVSGSNKVDTPSKKALTSNQSKVQNGTPGQRIIKTKRSGSTPDARSPTRSPNRQQTRSPSQSPHASRPRAVSSPKYIPVTGESSTLPRVKSPAKRSPDNKKTTQDTFRSENTFSSKSVPTNICTSPRNSYLQQKDQKNNSRTSSQGSISSSQGKLSHTDSKDKMSKIPSLARTPSADKAEPHVSKIPSKNPPRSKIPSFSKADGKPQKVKEPEPKKSQIPPVSRSDSHKSQARSKIPSTSAASISRPDSAKENKDPVFNEESRTPKQADNKSRIPSFSAGSKSSKIPARNEAVTHTESEPSQEDHVDSPGKSKTPSHSATTGIPMSRIPSFGKGAVDKPTVNGPASTPQSKIHPPSSLPLVEETPESSGIPKPQPATGSKIPSLFPKEPEPQSPKNEIPEFQSPQTGLSRTESGSQKSKIPGFSPRTTQPESRVPSKESKTPSCGIRKPQVNGVSSPTTPDIPSPTQPVVSKISSPIENKTSKIKPPAMDINDQPNGNEPNKVKSENVELSENKEESPIEKYIRSEAQRMEKLLRDESVVVEVKAPTEIPEGKVSTVAKIESKEVKKAQSEQKQTFPALSKTADTDKPRIEKTTMVTKTTTVTKTTAEVPKEKPLQMETSKAEVKVAHEEPETLISDVLASYAPDLKDTNRENKMTAEKEAKKEIKSVTDIDEKKKYEIKPLASKSYERKPLETKAADERKPAESKSYERKTPESKPVEMKPLESKTAALKAAKPSTEGKETKIAPEQVNVQLNTEAKDTAPEKTTVDDIYFQTFGTFGKKEELPSKESPPSSRDKARPMPPKRTDSLGSKDAKDMGLSKRTEKPDSLELESVANQAAEPEVAPTDAPAIDTLGQYEQQSRRSKSRNRKVISPDGENDKEFVADLTAKDQIQAKREIDKDKYGSSPYNTEDEKAKDNKPPKKTSKSDKPKFVIESSISKDFYQPKRDSSQDQDMRPDSLIIANKTVAPSAEEAEKESAIMVLSQASRKEQFEDVDLNSQKESMREIAHSMDDLDGKAKCVGCGGRGKCVIS